MRTIMLVLCVAIFSGCGASGFQAGSTIRTEGYSSENDMAAEVEAACASSAHLTRRYNSLIEVRPGFQVSCH